MFQRVNGETMAIREILLLGNPKLYRQSKPVKRIIYMYIDDHSTPFINPELTDKSDEMIVVWDDCMCFPDLLVKVRRHKRCTITFRDLNWQEQEMILEDDLSELLQHEYDHLDGILAVSRAMDGHSFSLRSQRSLLEK